MMNRVFLDIGGRDSKVLKAYSGTAFMKDNSEEIVDRLKSFQKDASIITKAIENKNKK
jgi:NifB/MoaA-like Fe-S oxidoreductase